MCRRGKVILTSREAGSEDLIGSMEQVQGIGCVVDVVDPTTGDIENAEKSAGSGRATAAVEHRRGDLLAGWRRLDQQAVVSVRGQDVPIGGNGHTQRIVKPAVYGEGCAGSGGGSAGDGIGNHDDPAE